VEEALMKLLTVKLSFVACVTLMTPLIALGQVTTGTVTGTVVDTANRVIPAVNLTLESVSTAAQRTTVTSGDGVYTFTQLLPGTYTLTAAAQGFATTVQANIQVQINVIVRVDMALRPATVQEKVEVQGTVQTMQTESAATGGVVDRTSISELPLNGRNFIELVALQPGASSTAKLQGGGVDYTTSVFGGNYVVNGAPADGSTFLYDGIEMRDVVDTRVSFQPTIDAIQEFNFQATNYSAAFGRSAGGIVNIASRSGSDSFHGSAWEFLRNDVLDARNFFVTGAKPEFRQNQFGGAVGGPIRKGKIFFFVSYEGFRQTEGVTQAVTVPTVAERNGDFSAGPPIYNPLDIDPATGLRVQFPGNQIPTSLFSPVSVAALNRLYPLPSLPGAADNLILTDYQTITSDQVNARGDVKLSTADWLSGRYTTVPRENRLFPFVFSPLTPSVYDSPSMNAYISETHTFGTASVNEFKIGINRNHQILQDPDQGQPIGAELGITGLSTVPNLQRNPNIDIAGLSGTGPIGNAPNNRTDNQYTALDNYTWTKGSVTYSAGASIVRLEDNGGANPGSGGEFDFTGTFTGQLTPSLNAIEPDTGNAVADFLLGYPATSTRCCVTGPGFRNWRAYQFGTYFQADWKARRNLTLNMGLRYEIFGAPYEKYNRVAEPDLAAAPNAVLLFAGVNGVPRGFYHAQKDNVSPRIGLAYLLNQKTVARAAYGIFFLAPQMINPFVMSSQPPFTDSDSFFSSLIVPQLTLANAFPTGLGVPSAVYSAIDTHFQTAYIQSWNLSIQRELGFNTTFTAAYIGTKGTHLMNADIADNNPPPGPGPLQARRPIPGFGAIFLYDSSGYSNYNALQLKAEKRLSNGLSFLGSYAWSKCIDNGASAIFYGGNPTSIRDQLDGAMNRGLCNEDLRNRIVANAIYQLPFGKNTSGVLRQVVEGWVIEGILTIESGQPFSVFYPLDNSNTGIGLDTPDLVPGENPNAGPKTVADWFNLNAFTTPAPFTYGTAGRNIVVGPGTRDFDFALHKQFPITESQALQFRVEVFNLTNTPSFYQPGNVFDTPSFGEIGGAFDPREIQFAFRYVF
jgi:Carboxypeptidase regulatory-like domain/TonB dependent receptor